MARLPLWRANCGRRTQQRKELAWKNSQNLTRTNGKKRSGHQETQVWCNAKLHTAIAPMWLPSWRKPHEFERRLSSTSRCLGMTPRTPTKSCTRPLCAGESQSIASPTGRVILVPKPHARGILLHALSQAMMITRGNEFPRTRANRTVMETQGKGR